MRMLIVDDHELIQNALRSLLRELDADCEVEVAKDFSSAAELIEASPAFDLVLLDLGLPGMDGLAALIEMRSRYPSLPVVVVSAQSDRTSVIHAINLGAMGYILKSASGEAIAAALRTVVSGGIYLPTEIVRQAPPDHQSRHPLEAGSAVGSSVKRPPPKTDPNYGLTNAQMNVLRLLLRGLPNKLICRELALAESTVKSHLQSIFAALNVHNRTQAVLVASEWQIAVGTKESRRR